MPNVLPLGWYALLSPIGTAAPGAPLPGPWGPGTPGTVTGGLAEAITALATQAGGGVVFIEPSLGGAYNVNWPALPAAISNIHFVGAPSFDGPPGTVLNLTAGLTTQNQLIFRNCIFENIAFTSPSATAGDKIFYGRSNANNVFRHVTFFDNVLHPLVLHGANLWVLNCRFIQLSPPATIDQPIFSPLGPFICDGCEWNYAPRTGTGASGLFIGVNGADRTNGPFGPWWIQNCHFLDANLTGFYLDTVIDIEPPNPTSGSANPFSGLYVDRNIMYNGKVNISYGDDIWITNNYHRVTSVDLSTLGIAFVNSINSGASGPLPIGTLHVERNHAVQDAQVVTYTPKAVSLVHNSIRELFIRDNLFIVNAEATGATNPLGAITISNSGPSSPAIDLLVVERNDIGASSVPTTKQPAITIAGGTPAGTAGTITRLRVRANRLIGATGAVGINPPTLAGAFSSLLQLGWTGWTTKITKGEIHDNNWEDHGITTVPSSKGILTAGTLSPLTDFLAGSRNRVYVTPRTITVGSSAFTYTNIDGNAELLFLSGGAGVTVDYRGATLLPVTVGSFELGPLESITIHYTSAPLVYVLPA